MSFRRIRPPAVAGLFYPGDPGELADTVRGLLEEAGAPQRVGNGLKALIAPHAGYIYSGPVAASAFRELQPAAQDIRRIVLVGPSHRVWIRGLALPDAQALATPLGEVPVDPEGASAALDLPQVEVSREAHADEHSLEVELPFLQLLLSDFTVIPLVVGEATGEEVAQVLDLFWDDPRTRIVVSSDLSHYLPYDTANRVDRATSEEILQLQGPLEPHQACGAIPINGLLVAARRRRLTPELLDLRNSGDTAGDRLRVVGYGAFAFREA